MKPMMLCLFMATWLALAPVCCLGANVKETSAVKMQRVSRPASGISRPARPSKKLTPREQRRMLKARIAQVNKKFTAIQKRIEKVRDQKLRRALRLRLEILREKVIKRLRVTQHKQRRLPRKR